MKKDNLYHSLHVTFPGINSRISIVKNIPSLEEVTGKSTCNQNNTLLICDEHTHYIAEKINKGRNLPIEILSAGEEYKQWNSIEGILRKAKNCGLGRDAVFIGIGGGVVTDMAAFAASVYMRGVSLSLVSTSLLGMVDASAGGKTGFDLLGIKNLVGTFYPAENIIIPIETLITLPEKEWKSGIGEIIKTAVIGDRTMLQDLLKNRNHICSDGIQKQAELIANIIAKSMEIKCRIVEHDPQEKGSERMLLNLGHTFGHALESSLGLGNITHGEAVAWGIVRSCELGLALGIINKNLHDQIIEVIISFGFEINYSLLKKQKTESFMDALMNDKKKKDGCLKFIIPDASGARIVSSEMIPNDVLKEIIAHA
jgi:3-dehydroquinate synthase